MATTRANSTAITTSDSALTPEVRRKLKSTVLDLRHVVEDDFRRQLVAVAVTEEGVKPLAAGRALSSEQQRVRDTAAAMLKREVMGGASQAEAFATLLRESVFTFLNRAIGLRCLETRGLLVMDGQTETAITQQEELGGISSLYWRVRNAPGGPSQPREIWRETFRRACVAVSLDIRVLFDPEAEYAALFPLMPAMQRVVEALNDPLIPPAAYAEDAVLGWVYQYFQSEEKDRIFAEVRTKKKKIGGADIIPVTQLYTEQYMVDFLLQNSLGRTWMEMYPDSPAKAAWPYYVEPETPHSRPRKPLREWTVLDPCVGSGHFLVVAFDLLAQLYAEERTMAARGEIPAEWATPEGEVAQTILERNLYGIDIDRRATQLATLALYLKAREMGLPRPPRVNIVAADASFLAGRSWEKFLAGFEREPSVRRVLAAMAGYLKDIRELGSLLRPEEELKRLIVEEHKAWEAAGRPQQAGLFPEYTQPRQERLTFEQISDETFWEHLAYRAEAAIQSFYDSARASGDLDEQIVAGEAQRGFAFLTLCRRRYDVVCTNPPYMGSKNMGLSLRSFISVHYPLAKPDVYVAFMLRCADMLDKIGYAAIVTQNSWLYASGLAGFRSSDSATHPGFVRSTAFVVLAHLGPGGFEEITGEVVNTVLLVYAADSTHGINQVSTLRATHAATAGEKAALLREQPKSQRFVFQQQSLLNIPGCPVAYWLSPTFFNLLAAGSTVSHIAQVLPGLKTGSDERFLRFFWEVPRTDEGWASYSKGGKGYAKWHGQTEYSVDWRYGNKPYKEYRDSRQPYSHLYFADGFTFSSASRGSLGVRRLPSKSIFGSKGPGIFPASGVWVIAILNTRLSSYLIRTMAAGLDILVENVRAIPLPTTSYPFQNQLSYIVNSCIHLTQVASHPQLTDRACVELVDTHDHLPAHNAWCHTLESWAESLAIALYALDSASIQALYDEVGSPAGWHPLIAGYDALPELPADVPPMPQELAGYFAQHKRVASAPNQLARLKERLRALYIAGPGVRGEDINEADDKNGNGEAEEEGEEGEGDAGQEAGVALGARIPIPAETFLEELSQKLEVHPISVYWLLEEMRREEGLVCPPEMKRQMEDYASVTLLRELGFRWPEQDKYEAEHGPILDPALVVEDGILPLVDCGTGATAAQQMRSRLERDFGEQGADESEAEFRRWVGRPQEEWVRRDFFKRHIQQFKQRPIAWHFVSPQKTFEAFVLYHKLCDESTGRETLRTLRARYAGGLITRLRAEQERARGTRDEREVTRLQLAIEDVEEFRERLEKIERGDDLKSRIRCRWKGDEAKIGRSGPYAPDINDGVKVNVRPFQELGLLAAPVIKKWD